MSKPMTHEQFVNLLQEWHIPYESNGRNGVAWYNHTRTNPDEGRHWGPDVYGIGNHHTGGTDNEDGASVLWNGISGLPGPLCHAGLRTNGYVLLNGWGRCNHFGLGDDDVLNHVVMEDYSGVLTPNEANTDGNRCFYGFEWMYTGSVNPETTYPRLYRTAVRLNAAICTFHNWKAESAIGHGEWQPGKWDPGYKSGVMFPMDRFRNHVEQAIKEGPNGGTTTPPPPTTTKTYTVVKGDTLSSVAKKYGTTPINLINLNPQLLQPGMKLTIKK